MSKRVLVLLLAAGLAAAPGYSQVVSGAITGRVMDRSGAAVPGAKVVVTNQETGAVRETESSSEGLYQVPTLPPGTYRLEATQPGFKAASVTNLQLLIDQTARVDLTLEVGEVSERVTVEAAATQLKTDTPTIGQVIEGRPVVELPLNGRNFLQLASLSAGVAPATLASSESARLGRAQLTAHVAGGRGSFNSFLIDGQESRGARFGETSILPPPDVVREFKIQRNFYSAEYGSSPGVISVAIKNGTNQFHGSVYHFLRNDVFDSPGFFDGGNKPPFRLNQFGATFGGPIIRDKTFFFGGWESRRQRRANQQFARVPDPRWLAGDFSSVATPIRDPLNNNQPFPGNRIPADRLSQVAQNFAAAGIPAPNTNQAAGNYTDAPSNLDDFDQYHIRVDHSFSQKDTIFARYSNSVWDVINPGLTPFRGTSFPLNGRNVVVQETHVFSPTLVNTLKLGFTRNFMATSFAEVADQNLAAQLGLRNTETAPADFALPRMQIAGFGAPGAPVSFGHWTNTFRQWTNTYAISDTLAWVKGKHNITMGVDFRHNRAPQLITNQSVPRFQFTGQFTGNAVADYVLGYYQFAETAYTRQVGDYRMTQYAGFIQDDIKLLPNFTLNLGLRYEHQSPWREHGGSEGHFDFTTGTNVLRRPPADYGFNISSPFIRVSGEPHTFFGDYQDWAPRVGFAWSVTRKTVIRGGAGMFYALNHWNDVLAIASNPGARVVIQSALAANQRPRSMDTLFDPPAQAAVSAGGVINIADRERQSPYMAQWNFNIQRELPGQMVLEVGYVGSIGRQLVGRLDWNQAPLLQPGDTRTLQQGRPYPQWGSIWQFMGGENSNYHAGTASLERRFSKGFSFMANYTWAKSMDTYSSSIDDGSTPHQIYNARFLEYGPSAFDITHRLAINGIWELPFGKGKQYLNALPTAANWIIGGWQVNGIFQTQTGNPFTVTVVGDQSNTGTLATHRPNRIGDGRLDNPTPARWFDTNAFVLNPRNTFGNSGRSILRQDGAASLDMSFFKNNFFLERRFNLQFRAEIFNITNIVNFARPGIAVNGANFGVVTAAGPAREVQFALRLVF
jgi:hypothetical protein